MRRIMLLTVAIVALTAPQAHGQIVHGPGVFNAHRPHVVVEPGIHNLADDVSPLRRTPTRDPASTTSQPHRKYNTSGVEQWRSLVERYFGKNTDAALSVMRKESGGNPYAHNPSGASGLFQQMPAYWPQRIAEAEKRYGRTFSHDIFDPEANIAASAVLSNNGNNWSHWSVRP